MGKYSFINVSKMQDGYVDGVWMQDFTGEKEDALQRAKDTEKVNSYRISVAVVDNLPGSSPNYNHYKRLKVVG